MSAMIKPKLVTVRRKKIELQIERDKLSYHLQKGWLSEVRSDKNELVEATPGTDRRDALAVAFDLVLVCKQRGSIKVHHRQ